MSNNKGATALMSLEKKISEEQWMLPFVEKTRVSAEKMGFVCKIYPTSKSGASSKDASEALGVDATYIIKTLYLKDQSDNKLAVILSGNDRLNTSLLKEVWLQKFPSIALKKLNFVDTEDLERDLGYKAGGVPCIAFALKNIPTFVDTAVYNLDLVIGSGGTAFHAMEFNPKQLIYVTNYFLSNVSASIYGR